MRLRPIPTPWLPPLTVALAAAGFLTGSRLAYPVLTLLPAWPTLAYHVLEGRRGRAVGAMLVWAASLAFAGVILCYWFPLRAAETVWHGPEYSRQMFSWLETGVGAESEPRLFLPQHALHLLVFVFLSLATASVASLFFGTLLMNYMAFYVARVLEASAGSPLAAVMGWHPWSILRVTGYIILGVLLAEPMLGWTTGFGRRLREAGSWLAVAGVALVADVLLKAALAPAWRLWLRSLMHMAGA